MSAGPHHCLSKPRHSENCDALGIDTFVGLEIIHASAQTPSPRGDRAPFIRRRLRFARLEKLCAHSIGDASQEIRIDIAVINRSEAKPRVQQADDVDLSKSPALIRGNFLFVRSPNLTHADSGIVNRIRVRGKAYVQQKRHWLLRVSGQIEQEVHLRTRLIG